MTFTRSQEKQKREMGCPASYFTSCCLQGSLLVGRSAQFVGILMPNDPLLPAAFFFFREHLFQLNIILKMSVPGQSHNSLAVITPIRTLLIFSSQTANIHVPSYIIYQHVKCFARDVLPEVDFPLGDFEIKINCIFLVVCLEACISANKVQQFISHIQSLCRT